jgi:hypothetical protein
MTVLPAQAGTAMAGKVRCSIERTTARFAAAAMLAGLVFSSCDPQPKTDLSGRIDGVLLARQHPSLTVDELVGGFDICLELGEAAPGPVDVAPNNGTFKLVRESDQKPLTDLEVGCLTTRHIEAGQTGSVHVTVAEPGIGQTLPTPVLDEICASGMLRIDGIVSNSADGGLNTPLSSSSFELLNCPR